MLTLRSCSPSGKYNTLGSSDSPSLGSSSQLASSLTVARVPNLSESWFPHLKSGDNSSAYIVRLFED